jgi:hypothetical protein
MSHVRKLDTQRVLRDMAEEAYVDDWLPEPWYGDHNPVEYGKKIKKAWKIAHEINVNEIQHPKRLVRFFKHVVAPILENNPWEVDYFEPLLELALAHVHNDELERGFGLGLYTRPERYHMLYPIINAFADAGVDFTNLLPLEY